MRLLKAKIGATLHLYDEGTQEETEAKIYKRVLAGEMAYYPDRTEWVNDEIIFDKSKEGSTAFQWNAPGTKVKHIRYYCVKITATGKTTCTTIGTVYKAL